MEMQNHAHDENVDREVFSISHSVRILCHLKFEDI